MGLWNVENATGFFRDWRRINVTITRVEVCQPGLCRLLSRSKEHRSIGSDIGIVRWKKTDIPPCASLCLLVAIPFGKLTCLLKIAIYS